MSHFTLAVFTDRRPCEGRLSQILAPFEETEYSEQPYWDWWSIGGRWLGSLLVKPGITDVITGEPGAFDNEAPKGGVDGARIGDLDLDRMLEKSRAEAGKYWDYSEERRKNGERRLPLDIETSRISREAHISLAKPFTPFAYILDGEWYQRGSMGWFGIVTDEKPQGEWNDHFASVLAQQPEDHWITVLDCHI